MKIGVTGAAGFIGGHVIDELVARGHRPVLFDTAGRTAHGHPVRMGDVRDETAMCELASLTPPTMS